MLKKYKREQPHIYSNTTQSIANGLSSYMLGRKYKYSTYQQIINSMSINIDRTFDKLNTSSSNLFLSTYIDSSLDIIYTVDDDGSNISDNNHYKDGTTQITNINLDTIDDIKYIIPDDVKKIEENKYSYSYELDSLIPRDTIMTNFDIPIYIVLHINGDGKFIYDEYDKEQKPTSAIIYGIDEFGIKRTEQFDFYYPTYYITNNKWQYIYYIDYIYWSDGLSSRISSNVESGFMNNILEDKTQVYTDSEGNIKPVFWEYDQSNATFNKLTFTAKNISDRYAGVFGYDTISSYRFMGYNDDDDFHLVSNISNFLPSMYDDKIYILSDNYILAYSKNDEYPSVVKYASEIKTPDPIVNLFVESDTGHIYIEGVYNILRPHDRIAKYRFRIKDGNNEYVIDNPSYNTQSNNNWIIFNNQWYDYELPNTIGFKSPKCTYGTGVFFNNDIVVILDIMLSDGTIETDTYVVEKQKKFPLYQYNLGNSYHRMVEISGYIVISNGFNKYRIEPIYNKYIYDSNSNKSIFFNKFDNLTKDGTNITQSLFNVFNELDSYGIIHSLPRLDGESNIDYRHRLRYLVNNTTNSTNEGLKNYISTRLGLTPYNMLYIHNPDLITISYRNDILLIGNNAPRYTYDFNIEDIEQELSPLCDPQDILDDTKLNESSQKLSYFQNYKYIYSVYDTGKIIKTNIPLGYKISNITINTESNTIEYQSKTEVDNHSDNNTLGYYFKNEYIYLSRELTTLENIDILIVEYISYIKYSNVIIRDIYSVNDNLKKEMIDYSNTQYQINI